MAVRRSRPKSFCLRPDQEHYIKGRIGNLGDFSRWVRGAIDLRITFERENKQSKMQRAMNGSDFDTETSAHILRVSRDTNGAGVLGSEANPEATGNDGAPVEEQPKE